MERRDFFFQTGALAALGALGAPGRAGAATDLRMSPAAMGSLLRRLDEQQAWMATAPVDGIFQAVGADPARDRARCEAFLRRALRSMHLARTFRDTPEHGRAHPGMQRRLAAALPEMSRAVAEAREFLVDLSPADRLDLQRTIRDNPDMLPRLAVHLEEEAARVAIHPDSRGQVRRTVEHLDRQMRRPGAGAAIDEYVARADRVRAEAGSLQDLTRRLQERLGAPAFQALQRRQEELARSWWEQPPPKDYPGAGEVFRMGDPPPRGDEDSEAARIGRHRMFVAGAVLLGVGAVPTALGLAFIPWTIGLSSIATTIAFPMMITGIVLMAVGRRST